MGNKLIKLLFFSIVALVVASEAKAVSIYGVTTSNQLVRFESASPNSVTTIGAITGLQSGENVLGIDFRPANGQLYAVGSTNRLYTINILTGAATSVGVLTTPLTSGEHGVDFNPVPDRLRITNDADQNLRANPVDATNIVDTNLAFAAGDSNAGQNPNIVASAYLNNFAGTTTTTLYNIDSNLDILVNQNPPNNGTLNTIGSLGINVTNIAGFDIAGGNQAFAALQVNGETASKLFSINLTTGSATLIGQIGSSSLIRGIAAFNRQTVDFDGDRKTDFSAFRLSNNNWVIRRSSNNTTANVAFGLAQFDTVTPADFDGDNRTDIAVWRSSDRNFYVLRSSDGTVQIQNWGLTNDEPVARDYDGDNKADFAVVRRGSGSMTWWILNSSNGSIRGNQFGLESDRVAPGDYDGDGKADLAVQRGGNGQSATFFIQQSTAGFRAVNFGLGEDFVVPGDYDGDGKTDIAVARQGTNLVWYALLSSNNSVMIFPFGNKPQLTTQGDYDGDGKTDVSVYDPTTGIFYAFRSSNQAVTAENFGLNSDMPIANFDTH